MIDPIKVRPVLIELHHLPCIEYFACISGFGELRIEACENYRKQTYRNRCEVLTTNKTDLLTVPVRQQGAVKLYRDIRIDYRQDWIRRHWGCFQSAYGKSPYYEFYAPDLERVYRGKPVFLFDLNRELLTICLKFLGMNPRIAYTLSYEEKAGSKIFDARYRIKAKKDKENCFFYRSIPYYQTFGNDFVPNLSIIDLLFNQGPESPRVLKESRINGVSVAQNNEQSE